MGDGRHKTLTFFSYTFASIKSLSNLDHTSTCFLFDCCVNAIAYFAFVLWVFFSDTY